MDDSSLNPYESPHETADIAPSKIPACTKQALWCAIGGNIAAMAVWCFLFRHRAGEAVRPMDLTLFSFLIAIGTILLVWPRAAKSFLEGHPIWGSVAFVFSLTPFVVGGLTMNVIGALLHLTFKP